MSFVGRPWSKRGGLKLWAARFRVFPSIFGAVRLLADKCTPHDSVLLTFCWQAVRGQLCAVLSVDANLVVVDLGLVPKVVAPFAESTGTLTPALDSFAKFGRLRLAATRIPRIQFCYSDILNLSRLQLGTRWLCWAATWATRPSASPPHSPPAFLLTCCACFCQLILIAVQAPIYLCRSKESIHHLCACDSCFACCLIAWLATGLVTAADDNMSDLSDI